jgi:hypothetical protein
MQGKWWPWWIWALVGPAALAGTILAVWKLPSLLYGDVSQASAEARLQATSGFRTALIAGLAGLAALGTLVMGSRTYRLTQQSQITDRYTKAIEQLGSDKLDVRLGGIYALERIVKDSKRDQPTVVEVLSAFVREHNDPGHTDSELGVGKQPGRKPTPTTDVRAALTVLGRLPSLPPLVPLPRADLSSAQFVGADLSGVNLSGFQLTGANLAEANLKGANLEKTILWRASLKGANLQQAFLPGAVLEWANLRKANLRWAYMYQANLEEADLEEADLERALLNGASLGNANLKGANLQLAFLQKADLEEAILDGVQLEGARCDAETVWPDGFDWRAAGVILEDN